MTTTQIQEFFGFSAREVEEVIEMLQNERLVRWEDDRLELTHYALGRFLESSDSIPRFSKIRDWSGEVAFELIGFTPMSRTDGAKRARLMVELPVDDAEKESKSRLWAERSFQENFGRIYRGARAEIYKISEVEPSTRFLLPVPCTFSLPVEGDLFVKRSLPEDFLADRLELSQAVTNILVHPPEPSNHSLMEFVTIFDDQMIRKHLRGGSFEIQSYLIDIIESENRVDSAGTRPIVGSLHLDRNKKLIEQWAKSGITSTELVDTAFWIAPFVPFWGRSRAMRPTVTSLSRILERSESGDHEQTELAKPSAIKVLLQKTDTSNTAYTKAYSNTLPDVYCTTGSLLDGRLELLLVRGKFLCALYHFQLAHPVTVPIGFISAAPEHLEVAEKLLRDVTKPPHIVGTLTKGGPPLDSVFTTTHKGLHRTETQ
jgi:hypothetical protein